jgi:hypothetical protein
VIGTVHLGRYSSHLARLVDFTLLLFLESICMHIIAHHFLYRIAIQYFVTVNVNIRGP